MALMGGPKSVDHLGPDPPPTGDLITASACPITDVGALSGLRTLLCGGTQFAARSKCVVNLGFTKK